MCYLLCMATLCREHDMEIHDVLWGIGYHISIETQWRIADGLHEKAYSVKAPNLPSHS